MEMDTYCALYLGVVDCHNCGIVLGALDRGLGLVVQSYSLYDINCGKGGPSNIGCNGPTPWQCTQGYSFGLVVMM